MPWHTRTPNTHKSTSNNSNKHKHEVSYTRLQINLNKELQNAPREALQIYIHKKKLRNHTQLSSQVIQQWGNMEKHNKEHYLKPIWFYKPGFCQGETQDQLHNPYASKAVFAQEGPYLTFVEEIIQYCMNNSKATDLIELITLDRVHTLASPGFILHNQGRKTEQMLAMYWTREKYEYDHV